MTLEQLLSSYIEVELNKDPDIAEKHAKRIIDLFQKEQERNGGYERD